MAIYHLHAQIISRKDGRSSVGAAAYRLGVELKDELTGEVFDYTRKAGVDGWAVLAPDGAPAWVSDPAALWNRVELAEKRKDAQLARELDIALPAELDDAAKRALLLGFVGAEMVALGMVAQVAFHDLDSPNPHAHVMLTLRTLGPDGFGNKNRDWNDKKILEGWREQWATHANRALAAAGSETRIDHRTLDAQKDEALARGNFSDVAQLDRPATKHEGPATTQARRKGHALPRAKRNNAIAAAAQTRRDGHASRFVALEAVARAQGRLQAVDIQALHAQALADRRRAGKTIPNQYRSRSPNGYPNTQQRGAATALTRDSLDGARMSATPGRGLEPLLTLRAFNRFAALGDARGGNAGGPGGFAPTHGRLLRKDAQGHHHPRREVQRVQPSALATLRAQRVAGARARTTSERVIEELIAQMLRAVARMLDEADRYPPEAIQAARELRAAAERAASARQEANARADDLHRATLATEKAVSQGELLEARRARQAHRAARVLADDANALADQAGRLLEMSAKRFEPLAVAHPEGAAEPVPRFPQRSTQAAKAAPQPEGPAPAPRPPRPRPG